MTQAKTKEDALSIIREALLDGKARQYGDEAVSEYEHAVQCAGLAERAGSDDELIVAALLHDFGRVVMEDDELSDSVESNVDSSAIDHGEAGASALASLFSPRVLDCIRYHADAKRYLCSTEDAYYAALSHGSKDTFTKQGGMMSADEINSFESMPYFDEMVQIRRWDDSAKVAGKKTKPLDHWMPIVKRVMI